MSTQPITPVTPPAYAATLSIDYPDRKLNRLTSFFRIFVIIPIFIILVAMTGFGFPSSPMNNIGGVHYQYQYIATAGILFLPLVLMILFRKKYPKWWFDWNLNLTKFIFRVESFLFLLRDEYPSTDEVQAIHLDLIYPDAQTQLMRGMPLVKWFLAIPHYIILFFLGIAAWVCVIITWFAILFTGRYPRGLFDFVVGVMRWYLRVLAYAILLLTDKYPPFSLQE